MTISIITAAASTLTDGASDPGLISQLNTALAPLLSDNIRGVSFITQGDDRLIGNELQVAITYDTSGAVITNPYVAVGFQAKSIEGVKTLLLAYLAAHPTYFFSTAWIQAIPQARQGSQYVGLIFYNVDAVEGTANWVVNGGGTFLGVTTGNTLWVDAVNGVDATGAPGIQTKPYLTIQAAINAATAGDTVEVRPGTYVQGLTLKNGVNIRHLPGAVLKPDNTNNILFQDSGANVSCVVDGGGSFASAQGADILARFQGPSTVTLRCASCVFSHNSTRGVWMQNDSAIIVLDCAGAMQFAADLTFFLGGSLSIRADIITLGNSDGVKVNDMSGNGHVSVRCRRILSAGYVVEMLSAGFVSVYADDEIKTTNNSLIYLAANGAEVEMAAGGRIYNSWAHPSASVVHNDAGNSSAAVSAGLVVASNGPVVQIISGSPTISVEAPEIRGDLILVDSGSTGATRASLKANTITATASNGNDGVRVNHAAAANYDIRADSLVCSVNNNGSIAVVNVTANRWTTFNNTTIPFSGTATGKTFIAVDGDCASVNARPIYLSGGAEVHLLRGRFIGFNDANGFAVRIDDDAALLRLYPGAVLIAGAAAASSIGLGGGAATPTVIAMGAIAANKAAAAGVAIAVGSLLVDPLVV